MTTTTCRMLSVLVVVLAWFVPTAHARWYDPQTGRWLTRDPLGTHLVGEVYSRGKPFNPARQYSNGMNLYQYAMSDPVGYTDPTGLDVWVENTTAVHGFHKRICVDTWNADCTKKTGKYCISFGMDGNGDTGSCSGSSEDGGSSDSDSSGDSSSSGDEGRKPGTLPPGTYFPIDGPDPNGDGIVYEDMVDKATKQGRKHATSCAQDRAALEYLRKLVDVKANYALCGQNCRDFSEKTFDYLKDDLLNPNKKKKEKTTPPARREEVPGRKRPGEM